MPKRKGFYDTVAVDARLDRRREENVERVLEPLLAERRTTLRELPIERIRPNPFQARRHFEVGELAAAIAMQGFVSRLRVRPDPAEAGYFQLVYGERRLRAARAAGLATVPCEIAEHTDDELIEIGLSENIQRQDLGPLEEARAFELLLAERGYTIRRLAERLGKDKGYIENRLVLLRVPDDVQALVLERPDTLRAAREIAKLDTAEARRPLLDGLRSGSLTAQTITALVRQALDANHAALATTAGLLGTLASQPPTTRGMAIERDARTMRRVVGRWLALAPQLAADERDALLQAVEAQLGELELLVATLNGAAADE